MSGKPSMIKQEQEQKQEPKQTPRRYVEVPEHQSIDRLVDVYVVQPRQVTTVQVVNETVALPQLQLLDKVVGTFVVVERQAPMDHRYQRRCSSCRSSTRSSGSQLRRSGGSPLCG